MVLEAVYEQDFLDCAYGFRPGRSAHQAIRNLWQGLMAMGGGWVLEADIEGFYDNLDHRQLRDFLDQRVRDGVLRRAIDKWLKASAMEGGNLSHATTGTPQGGGISPLLSNISAGGKQPRPRHGGAVALAARITSNPSSVRAVNAWIRSRCSKRSIRIASVPAFPTASHTTLGGGP